MQMCELLRKVRNADMGEKYSKESHGVGWQAGPCSWQLTGGDLFHKPSNSLQVSHFFTKSRDEITLIAPRTVTAK